MHTPLTDFGISMVMERMRLAQHGIAAAGYTQTGVVDPSLVHAGSILYMSPQRRTGSDLTSKDDV